MTVQAVVADALAASSGSCVVIADDIATLNVRWARDRVTTNGSVRSRRVTVAAIAGSSVGVVSHSGAIADPGDLVRAAERIARRVPPAEDAAPLVVSASSDWDAPPAETSLRVLDALLPELAEAFTAPSGQLSGYAEHSVRSTYVGSTAGTRLRDVRQAGLVDLVAHADGTSSWAGARATDSLPDLVSQVHRGLGWARRRTSLPEDDYEVLLAPSCVADLMLRLYGAAGMRAALDGYSPLALGDRLSSIPLTLRSDPAIPGLSCSPFVVARSSGETLSVFDTGLPLAPTEWMSDGVLRALVQTRHTARTSGHPVTPEIGNLVLSGPGNRSLSEMIAATRRGIVITSLWYLREVDPRRLLLTGTTRDGVYLVEDGEVVAAVDDFRLNESPVELLGRITEVGQTEPALPREWGDVEVLTAMPPLRVSNIHLLPAGAVP
ncbi:hypothetical protein ALI144C_37390 [Actinosynnema sp. ALI-1.44]|uniref:metallopeptidase TldD-related protein n=1 Tax=Actinosynnema sp. ALI-1.44 TaxID=1933779 RepID=UPI00097C7C41|nr:metallopeptidase TldD-related protein [Actinosynnema sp. ALI-1.44]ONI76333.1 hypothetical protein ALI144C_37390 [Actinosynnema sp. ALI-1.44]